MKQPQLVARIPGVTVRLTPNPLRCEVTLTEAAQRELILTLALENVLDQMYAAHYQLTETHPPNLDEAKRELKPALDKWLNNGKQYGFDTYKTLAHAWPEFIGALNEQHAGDCTAQAASCLRCHVERLVGIDTLPVDKSIGHRLWGVYVGSPEVLPEDVSRERERAAADAAFRARHPDTCRESMSTEQLSAWQRQCDATQASAFAYYTQHKTLYAAQQTTLETTRLDPIVGNTGAIDTL